MTVKTMEDVRDPKYNITHEDLINCMKLHEEEQQAAEQANTSFDNSAQRQHLKASGDGEVQAPIDGLNVLTYEENHNFLRDLQTQQKRKFFPTMAEDSQQFSQLLFPASRYMLDEYNGANAQKLAKDSSEHTPLSGNWSLGAKAEVSTLSPAGQRVPKQFNVG